jgi:preprotein translocase subunit SecY
MLDSFRNIFAIPDLRKRVFFTFLLLGVYRIGAHIPTPGINGTAVAQFFAENAGTVFGFVDMFSGGAFSQMTIFSLGIMPYISASIILQLLTVVWPYLKRLQEEGELGRKRITQYTRYGTIVLSIIQASAIALYLEKMPSQGGMPIVTFKGWGFRLLAVLTMTTGTAFIMWLGEQISDRGIGNGISLIIFAGIIVRIPAGIQDIITSIFEGRISVIIVALVLIVMVLVIAAIVYVERAQRRIPISYAKRVVGRRLMGGQGSHLPLKVNTGGVIPVIFASSVLMIPSTIGQAFSNTPWVANLMRAFNYGEPMYNLLYFALIVFFCYFYTAIIFNPVDVAENMRKNGSFIPGIRPGKNTSDYIDRILSRLTFAGAIYLAIVALIPQFFISGFKVSTIPGIGAWLDDILPFFVTHGMGFNFYFGGTSLLIVVGVAMDTVQQIESQLIMRHYEGLVKGARIKGRR